MWKTEKPGAIWANFLLLSHTRTETSRNTTQYHVDYGHGGYPASDVVRLDFYGAPYFLPDKAGKTHKSTLLTTTGKLDGLLVAAESWCPGRVEVVHLCPVVVRLGVSVEPQLIVITRKHPQKVRVVTVPVCCENA